jgi:hypothetical protein
MRAHIVTRVTTAPTLRLIAHAPRFAPPQQSRDPAAEATRAWTLVPRGADVEVASESADPGVTALLVDTAALAELDAV